MSDPFADIVAVDPHARLGLYGDPAASASDVDHGGIGSVLVLLSAQTRLRLTYAQARELHDALRPLVTRCPSSRTFARSPEGERLWRDWCDDHDVHPHDRAVIEFAERWGAEMERRIQAVIGPPTVCDVAYDAQGVAGAERLTGQQRRLAGWLLCLTWTRGAELRDWMDS